MDDAIYGTIINKLCRLFSVKPFELQKPIQRPEMKFSEQEFKDRHARNCRKYL